MGGWVFTAGRRSGEKPSRMAPSALRERKGKYASKVGIYCRLKQPSLEAENRPDLGFRGGGERAGMTMGLGYKERASKPKKKQQTKRGGKGKRERSGGPTWKNSTNGGNQ